MKFIPLGDRILVKPAESSKVSKGGIHIPNETPSLVGEVIEIGETVYTVKKNDIVAFPKYDGVDIELDEVEYKIFKEKALLGIIKEND